ncbi:MAG: hypothetical protein U9O94_08725 [Nanoarchaeota archaeon]|nr:hypothetical protein [Nanoarchaeota archaeon]
MDIKNLKLEIFKAVISSGSMQQKDNWKSTADSVYNWIEGKDTAEAPKPKPRS